MSSKISKWWQKDNNGLNIMYGLFGVFFTAFTVFLTLYLIDESKMSLVTYQTWYSKDSGKDLYFGLDLTKRQFLTFNASFEVIGSSNVDVSKDFKTTVKSGTSVQNIEFFHSSTDVNVATIILEPDSSTQRKIKLQRLTLQSLTDTFNSVQNVPTVTRLFNEYYT
jgi:hypothetical protein